MTCQMCTANNKSLGVQETECEWCTELKGISKNPLEEIQFNMMCSYGKRKADLVIVISLFAGIAIGLLWRYMDYLVDLLCFMCVCAFEKPESTSTALQDPDEHTGEDTQPKEDVDSVDTS